MVRTGGGHREKKTGMQEKPDANRNPALKRKTDVGRRRKDLRPLSSVFRPLSSVFRPLSSVLCPPSSVLCPLYQFCLFVQLFFSVSSVTLW